MRPHVRLALRGLNVLVALVTLTSALAVVGSDLFVPGYRVHYRDALWFVTTYAALQVVMLAGFLRGGWIMPWLALAKAAAAGLFLVSFDSTWPYWRFWTPARYVYQLFDWGEGGVVGLFAFVFLGRGAFNAVNAMVLTEHWWGPLRHRRPLLGRALTAVPVAATVLCVWAFFALLREEAQTFSAEARDVAQLVYQGLDCDAVRANAGKTTTDLRRRGEQQFEVRVAYGCAMTRVVVRAEDGRLGTASGAREECCAGGS